MNEMQRMIRHELLDATDEFIDDAVQFADPMVLRGLIYQLTGDPEVADTELATVARSAIPMPAPANQEVADLLRRKAAEYLKSYRDAGAGPVEPGPVDRLHDSIRLTWGQPIKDEHIQMYAEELALDLGYADVRLYTNRMFDANVRLYLAFGYRIDREETSALGVTVHMSKPLRGAVPVA